MALDVALELSVEQLISALNEKLFTEFASVRSKVPPASRTSVAGLTAKVRSGELKAHSRDVTRFFQVDALERRAKDVLHEVISLRNALRPVNRLHPEVIALCAAFVSDTDPKPVIPLTHVCRYWRRAVVSSPRNWASVGSGWKRLAPLCVMRSAAVPLSVKISVSDIKGDEGFLRTLIPHVSRISGLSLTGYSSMQSVADDLPGFFTSPMPSLTSLELEQTDQPAEAFPSNDASTPPLFRNLSKLRSLHLIRTPLYPTVFSITSLVELKLVNYAAPFHFGEFIRFLHSNPNLELVILDLGFSVTSALFYSKRKISLPRLQRLVFTCGNAADASTLLSWVSLPPTSHITIQGSQSNPRNDLASFLPSPPTRIQEMLAPITAIKYCSSRWLHIFGEGQLSFQSSKYQSKICDGLDLFVTGAVREFHINTYSPDANGDYLSWPLRRLPVLEALVFSEIRLPLGSLFALAKEPPLCPSLKTIAFFDCVVTEAVITELERVLAKRRDSTAARLYRVVIVNATHALPKIQLIYQLRKFVPRVDVGIGNELPDLL